MTTRSPRRPRQHGFTLIELMVALVVSAIVVLGIFAFSSIQRSTASIHERHVRSQQALEGAMWSIAQDVRQAGLGFTRLCSELRIWDADASRLINPGAVNIAANAVTDSTTGEAYWVLRDGFQAHWNSTGAGSLQGVDDTSASPTSAADSFDVIMAEANYTGSLGVFTLEVPVAGGDTFLSVRTSPLLDNANGAHVAQVQQLFPPGTFVAIARTPPGGTLPFRPEIHGQCMLLQVTGDVAADPGDAQLWQIPITAVSGFNADLAQLVNDGNGGPYACGPTPACDDWDTGARDNQGAGANAASVVPLGRLRWSRYELDFIEPRLPYLVRYDLIGWQQGDPDTLGGVDYPHCTAGTCQAPQLHLPGAVPEPAAVAIGPMIEDMQVAVGCDGYTVLGAASPTVPLPVPDVGFEEVGPAEGPTMGIPNNAVDENTNDSMQRDDDEWLGNAQNEQTAPDCVWYGTAEYLNAGWMGVEGSTSPPPAFRMSPQSVRVTLVGSAEGDTSAGGLASANAMAIEDRPQMPSPTGLRERFTLTERFMPDNLRWRDPSVD